MYGTQGQRSSNTYIYLYLRSYECEEVHFNVCILILYPDATRIIKFKVDTILCFEFRGNYKSVNTQTDRAMDILNTYMY